MMAAEKAGVILTGKVRVLLLAPLIWKRDWSLVVEVARNLADFDALVYLENVVALEELQELLAFDGDAAVVGRVRLSVLPFPGHLS